MNRGAQIAFKGHEKLVPCTIHDMSDSGARISLDVPLKVVPRIFTLVLFQNSVQRNCRVVWVNGRLIGAKFVSEWFGMKLSQRPNSLVGQVS